MIAVFSSEREAEETLWALRDATQRTFEMYRDKHGRWSIFEKVGGSWKPLTVADIEEAIA